MNKKIQYGASSFKEIKETKALYIDKTQKIFELITEPTKRFFISRPRRFGKSLLIDMLSEIFQGNKKLFKGLAICNQNYTWEKYPVIKLDMSSINLRTPESVEKSLCKTLRGISIALGVKPSTLADTDTPKTYLTSLIQQLAKQDKKVVILIDEYDYPVISNLENGVYVAEKYLKVLQDFYLSLKTNTNHIHFLFITGVTQLAHTTIFSGLNNLKDISDSLKYADLMGYTQKELEFYFKDLITREAKVQKLSKKFFLDKVKQWYDGYRFSDSDMTVYNPSDINLFFQDGSNFKTYWIGTGTPSFILKILQKHPEFNLLEELKKPRSNFLAHNIIKLESKLNVSGLLYLLFQTGYITIKDVDKDGFYKLGFPNKEVEISFTTYLSSALYNTDTDFFDEYTYITKSLIDKKPEKFIKDLNILFKSLSHPVQKYQENAIGLAILTILHLSKNIDVESQIHSGKGISDIVALTSNTIYVMELKVGGTASSALNQIKKKDYPSIYVNNPKYRGKKIVLMGICFNGSDASVKDSRIELL